MQKLAMILTVLAAIVPTVSYGADMARDRGCFYGGVYLDVGHGVKYCTHPATSGGCLEYNCMVCQQNGTVKPGYSPDCYRKKD